MKNFVFASAFAAPLLAGSAFAQTPDSDGDGVPDPADAFPCDASSSAESYSPALASHGMLLGEDFWPVRLDDDYQDAVIVYNYGFKLDASGAVTYVRATFDVIAAGGTIDIGVGLRLPLPSSTPHLINATIGGRPHTLMTVPDSNLTNQLVADIRAQLFPPGTASVVNALANRPTIANNGPLEVIIEFTPPVPLRVGETPYDVYLFRTTDNTHEIHMSQYCGTNNMNTALFGTGIDNSNPPNGPCYIDGQGLPSMLHVPEVILYPLELTDISLLYPLIVPWAASGGTTAQNWYQFPVTQFAYPTPLTPGFNGNPRIDADYSCPCPSGYNLNPQPGAPHQCDDENECLTGNHGCDVNGTCTNTPGGYNCACNMGYAGDGFVCNDINECANGTHNCSVNATCTNTQGGFTCTCNSGYAGDGFTCTPSIPNDFVFPPTTNVLAQFELNGDANDVSGNGRNASLLGGTFVSTRFGQGLSMPFIDPSGFDWSAHRSLLGGVYTIEMVLTPADTNCWRKLFSYNDASDLGWYYCSNGFNSYNFGGLGVGTMQPGVRHYLAFVQSTPNVMTVYFQGNPIGSITSGISGVPVSAVFFRDDSGTGRNERFNGVVDAVRISSVARTPAEIAAIQARLAANP